MTAVVEAVVLIAFVFAMGLIFGLLVAMIFGRKDGGPGPRRGGRGSASGR